MPSFPTEEQQLEPYAPVMEQHDPHPIAVPPPPGGLDSLFDQNTNQDMLDIFLENGTLDPRMFQMSSQIFDFFPGIENTPWDPSFLHYMSIGAQ